MKEMSPYAPDRWIRVLNRHFPNLWTRLRKAYQQPSLLGDREYMMSFGTLTCFSLMITAAMTAAGLVLIRKKDIK